MSKRIHLPVFEAEVYSNIYLTKRRWSIRRLLEPALHKLMDAVIMRRQNKVVVESLLQREMF